MGTDYIEVSLAAVVDSGDLLAYLPGGDAVGAWESEGSLHLYWPQDSWKAQILEDLEAALRRLGTDGRSAGLKYQNVPDQDWNDLWVRSLQPVLIGSRIFVRQSWSKEPAPAGALELVIDPKRAFGSGYHPTTQLLVTWMSEGIRGGERVLDLGTGSGILSMAALRLGATSALGVDNDPQAVECARENAALNGFGPELEFQVASVEDLAPDTYEMIVANIDRKTLLTCAGGLGSFLATDGSLLLSGLQVDDLIDVRKTVESGGGRICRTSEQEEWIALEIRFS